MIEGRKVIISLTTIPSRMTHIYPCLIAIDRQKFKPDEIVLVLPKESKREPKEDGSDPYVIPENIQELVNQKKLLFIDQKEIGVQVQNYYLFLEGKWIRN